MKAKDAARYLGIGARTLTNYAVRYKAGEFPKAPAHGIRKKADGTHYGAAWLRYVITYVVRSRDFTKIGADRTKFAGRGRPIKRKAKT